MALAVTWGTEHGIYLASADQLTTVADVETPIPRGSGSFTAFGMFRQGDPWLDDGEVAFFAEGSGQEGIYRTWRGTLLKVADRRTHIPGGSGTFREFGAHPSLDGSELVLLGFGDGGQEGVYRASRGGLSAVADRNTAIPEGTGTFGFLRYTPPAIDGGVVAFVGSDAGWTHHGVYKTVGRLLVKVADQTTPIPGGSGTFSVFGGVIVSEGDVIFTGVSSDSRWGIYRESKGVLSVVVDSTTPIPGGSGTFSFVRSGSMSGGELAFSGAGSNDQAGIYVASAGRVIKIADRSTPIPGRAGTFRGFSIRPSISDGTVAFSADPDYGIYLVAPDGALTIIADRSTLIPRGLSSVGSFGLPSLAHGVVAFRYSDMISPLRSAYYTESAEGLDKIVDYKTPIPGRQDVFTHLSGFSFSQGQLAFSSSAGIFKGSPGNLVAVADSSTLAPGTTTPLGALGSHPSISDGRVAFWTGGRAGPQAIYKESDAGLVLVADLDTPAPDSEGTFDELHDSVKISHGEVAFAARVGESWGLYKEAGGGLVRIVTVGAPLPDGSATFTGTGRPSFSDGEAAFYGYTSGGSGNGIYKESGGTLVAVADPNTAIPGGTGNFARFGLFPSIRHGEVVFEGTGRDGLQGIYRASRGTLVRIVDLCDVLDRRNPTRSFGIGDQSYDGHAVIFAANFSESSAGQLAGLFVAEAGQRRVDAHRNGRVCQCETVRSGPDLLVREVSCFLSP